MNRFALLVGVSNYVCDGLEYLRTSHNDVDAIEALLTDSKWKRSNIEKLLDGTYNQVREKLIEMAGLAKPGDLMLLYFSGHGLRGDGIARNSRLYLACSDTRVDKSLLDLTAISFERVARVFCCNTQLVCILDCCYAGLAKDSKGGGALFDKLTGTWIAAACSATEPARLGDGTCSLYTHELCLVMKEKWNRGEKDVNIAEAHQVVQEKLKDRMDAPPADSLHYFGPGGKHSVPPVVLSRIALPDLKEVLADFFSDKHDSGCEFDQIKAHLAGIHPDWGQPMFVDGLKGRLRELYYRNRGNLFWPRPRTASLESVRKE